MTKIKNRRMQITKRRQLKRSQKVDKGNQRELRIMAYHQRLGVQGIRKLRNAI